jgi:protein TonB
VPVKNAPPNPRAAQAAPEPIPSGSAEPTATQPASGPPAAARQDGAGAQQSSAPAIDSGWIHAIGAWLAAHKTYPEQARARGDEGRETVRLTIDRQGHVTGLEVVRSSGSDILDEATAAMLRGATLPALPPAMTQPGVTITVQIHYALTP